jgi:hypothetical protein
MRHVAPRPHPEPTMIVVATERALQALPATGSRVVVVTPQLTEVTFPGGTRFTDPEFEHGSYYFGVRFRHAVSSIDLELVFDPNEHLSWPWMLIAPSARPAPQQQGRSTESDTRKSYSDRFPLPTISPR